MAKKKIPQENCTFCDKQPCECVTTKNQHQDFGGKQDGAAQ